MASPPLQPRNTYALAQLTGTMGATIAANSPFFCITAPASVPPGLSTLAVYRVTVDFTTIVTFTTAVTAGRGLALSRATGTSAGGTAVTTSIAKVGSGDSSVATARVSTTSALTGLTPTTTLGKISLTGYGTSGNTLGFEWDFTERPIIVTAATSLIVATNENAMDAAGTWQATVSAYWAEV